MENGVLAGYPMVDVKVTAGRRLVPRGRLVGDGVQDRRLDGVQGGLPRRPSPRLLEPIMDVEVVVPEEYMGDVIGDLIVAARPHRRHVPAARRRASSRPRCRWRRCSATRRACARSRRAAPCTRCSSPATRRCPQAVAEEIVAKVKG